MNSVVLQFVVGLSSLFPHRMWNPVGGFCCHDPRGDGVYHHPRLLSTIVHCIWKESNLSQIEALQLFVDPRLTPLWLEEKESDMQIVWFVDLLPFLQ